MFNLVIILITIIAGLINYLIDVRGRYKRLLSSYKSIGQALVKCGGMSQNQYDDSIKHRK